MAISEELQEEFSRFSGDRNPIHTDALAARRTQAGEPVVHGVHIVLWALNALAKANYFEGSIARLRVKFLRYIYIGEEASLLIPASSGKDPASFRVEVGSVSVVTAQLEYKAWSELPISEGGVVLIPLERPREPSFTTASSAKGRAFVNSSTAAEAAFPYLARLCGRRCVAEIAACSYVVGMEVPALHSLFSALSLTLRPGSVSAGLDFEVTSHDLRFHKLRIAVRGSAIEGNLEAFARSAPVHQATMEQIAEIVVPNDYAGVRALVIGGSRGLGEVTAKILAAGGGQVVVTYAVGKLEADRLVNEASASGKNLSALAYDVRRPASDQLQELPWNPTHLFYFATNSIFKSRKEVFSAALYAEYTLFYVHAFYELCKAMVNRDPRFGKLVVYYPSSIAVEERPSGMTEYCMAKAAGEQLCKDLSGRIAGLEIHVSRLPRLATDQTSGLSFGGYDDALLTLLPIVNKLASLG